jgi:hypothetical protein
MKDRGLLKDFLKSRAFACPHCEQGVIYPENADTTLSAGLFVAVILAPLFHYWQYSLLEPQWVFAIGAAVSVIGVLTQKLDTADLP